MERLINRRQQGDLGEASAIEWLTRQGATVFTPLGHSPDVDLVACLDEGPMRIQVKTSAFRETRSNGQIRWQVQLATLGGNRSWNRMSKKFDPNRCDYLFVLVGDGRRWFVPAEGIEASTALTLGGQKYSEFEVEASTPILELIYGPRAAQLESGQPGEYPSGQRMAPVKRQAQPSQVRILPPPFEDSKAAPRASGTTQVWGKRRITIPLGPFVEAGFEIGDRVRASSNGTGQIVLSRIVPPPGRSDFSQTALGTLDQ
jgi:hypothetical protein